MTVSQIINRLSKNSVEFLLAGDREKSNACMELLGVIEQKGLKDIRGKLFIDNITAL